MNRALITSTESYSGKSGICLTLVHALQAKGLQVGYFKPYGTLPVTVDGLTTDKDAYYLNAHIDPPAPIDAVCPVVETRGLVERFYCGDLPDLESTVRMAFDRVASDRDAVVIEGASDLTQGASLGLTSAEVAHLFSCSVLLVARFDDVSLPDHVLSASLALGDNLAGVLFNAVPESRYDFVDAHVRPLLEKNGIATFGIIPRDETLLSVTVREIAESLGAVVLCADGQLDQLVESFMVGAMGQEKALRFFRRKPRKAVITGGDRSDVQLAALETDTRCLILTGDLPPESVVLARAEDAGVPMLLVGADTLAAVENMEGLFGRARLHDPRKADRIREMFETAVDQDRLLSELRLI